MKKNITDINELFAAAKSEQPVISENEISEIIRQSSLPAKNINFGKSNFGGKKMLSIIGISAAIISAIMLNLANLDVKSGDEKVNQNKIEQKTTTNQINSNNDVSSKNNTVRINITKNSAKNEKISETENRNNEIIITNRDNKEILPPEDKYAANNKPAKQNDFGDPSKSSTKEIGENMIKGINYIKLQPEELSNLGFRVDKDGKYIEVIMSKKNPVLKKIYVDSPILDVKEENTPEKIVDYVIPRMITDNAGKRRIEILSDDNKEIRIDTYMDNKDSMNFSFMKNKRTINSDNEVQNSTMVINIEQNKEFNIDSLNKNGRIFRQIQNTDSISIDCSSVDHNMIFQIDSLDNKTINIEDMVKPEFLLKIAQQQTSQKPGTKFVAINPKDINKVITAELNMSDCNDETSLVWSTEDSKTPNPMFNIIMPKLDINKLLPVEISIPNATDRNGKKLENFSFILWLNLDDETYSKLPQRLQDKVRPEYEALNTTNGAVCGFSPNENGENYLDIWRTCSGAIENMNTVPNPTSGTVNLSFLLKENRNITISVNDVFGKKVKDVVINQRMTKGDNLQQFDISDLESGMYLVVVQTNAGEQALNRVILKK